MRRHLQFIAMQDFSFLQDEHTQQMVCNGYNAITQLELWVWLGTYEPVDVFMWDSHPNILAIMQKMETIEDPPSHSGASFGCTMRHLQFIAKNGMTEYINTVNTQVNVTTITG